MRQDSAHWWLNYKFCLENACDAIKYRPPSVNACFKYEWLRCHMHLKHKSSVCKWLASLERLWMVKMIQEEHHIVQSIYLYDTTSYCFGLLELGWIWKEVGTTETAGCLNWLDKLVKMINWLVLCNLADLIGLAITVCKAQSEIWGYIWKGRETRVAKPQISNN